MKPLLAILILWTGTAYTQPQSDGKICLPDSAVRNLVIAREQGKLLKQQVIKLDERIVLLQATVAGLKEKDSITIASHNKEIKELQGKEDIYKGQLNVLTRMLKRERMKRKLTAGAGILTTGIMVFMSLKK